ncbi:MAG: 4-(cytidine 5'-diphospho)-2-C-methyl-D-erythritol kinase [Myxococcota bacterium]
MSTPLALETPAKVNLGLRVRARRADGYHEIESLFVPIDLCDRVELRVAKGRPAEVVLRLHDATPDVPADDRNLAARAARRFLTAGALRAAVAIDLTKRIPSGAGLGGGSSDAGAVLRLLDRAFPGALTGDALARLARALGADVPFFLDPRPARVRGVGERIEPAAGVASRVLLLVKPEARLATAEVYRARDALGPAPEPSPDDPLHNDLEAAAVRLCPQVRRLRQGLLEAGARAVALSGSGPTLYGVFGDRDQARAAARRFPAPLWTRVATTAESR